MIYEVVIHGLEKWIGASSNPLSVKELCKELKLKYQKSNGGRYGDSSDDKEGEIGLYAGGFKGKCNNCGKIGHKKADCRAPGGGVHAEGNGGNKKVNPDVKYYYCHKKGHYKSDYPKLKKKNEREKANAAVEKTIGEVSLAAVNLNELQDVAFRMETCPEQELFIADSGASVHLTGSCKGMINLKDLKNDSVTVGNGNSIDAVKIGDKEITILQEDGKEKNVVLQGCKNVPKLGTFSLISLTNSIDKGHQSGNEEKHITIRKGDFKLKFDRVIKTKSGYVCGVATKLRNNEDVSTPTLGKTIPVDVNHFHALLGYFGKEKTRAVAKYLE